MGNRLFAKCLQGPPPETPARSPDPLTALSRDEHEHVWHPHSAQFELHSAKLDEDFRDCSFTRGKARGGGQPEPAEDIQGISAIEGRGDLE